MPLKPESLLVSAGRPEAPGSPLNAPLVPASNFLLGDGTVYSREDGTPTWAALETVVAALEGGPAVAFASGMAAVSAVFEGVPAGGEVALPEDCYQGVASLAKAGAAQGRWRLRALATEDTDAWVDAAATADLLWVESPSNPMLRIADLPAIAAAPRKAGGRLAVDNTFATPLLQRPLALGADFSVHSATKFIGGHSDLLAGVVAAANAELAGELARVRQRHGATPGVLEAYLAARGARTLAVRLQCSQRSALELAAFLDAHPRVRQVHYPGLRSHPEHERARCQLGGFGAIVSFEVEGGRDAARAVCRRTRLIRHATSLGSVESTLERRGEHAGQEHVPPGLLRLSVGIEAVEDLRDDLAQALQAHVG